MAGIPHIASATAETLILATAQVGMRIRVMVSFTDNDGYTRRKHHQCRHRRGGRAIIHKRRFVGLESGRNGGAAAIALNETFDAAVTLYTATVLKQRDQRDRNGDRGR